MTHFISCKSERQDNFLLQIGLLTMPRNGFPFFRAPRYNTSHEASHCAPVAQRLEQQTHNLLVRGSNPCGGTNQTARVLTLTSSCCWAISCSTSRWREDGAIGARASRPH